jgi:hypothetical protein
MNTYLIMENTVIQADLIDEFKKTDTSTQIEGKTINSDIDPNSSDIAKS